MRLLRILRFHILCIADIFLCNELIVVWRMHTSKWRYILIFFLWWINLAISKIILLLENHDRGRFECCLLKLSILKSKLSKPLMSQNGLFTISPSLVHEVLDRSKSTSTYYLLKVTSFYTTQSCSWKKIITYTTE